MGSGSSRTKVKKYNRGNQTSPTMLVVPSAQKLSLPVPSKSHDPLFVRTPPKSSRRPMSVHGDLFELETNIEEYSTIWDHDNKLSSSFQQLSKSPTKNIDHHQKETLNNRWNKLNATNVDAAHVESMIDTQTHSCINLSSSDKIDELISNLNNVHTQLDKMIERRTTEVSNETKTILSHILNETQQKQQRLLNYAREQQSKQDEKYQKLLQEYITQLDQIKAQDLADIQKQLQNYREQILEESQLKIMTVNDQANIIKGKILEQEQHQASEKIDSVVSQIQKLSADEKVQHLGSEMKTETNIKTNTIVGTRAPGQTCDFDFHRSHTPEERLQSTKTNVKIQKVKQNE